MTSGTPFEQGKIFLADIPFTDLSDTKRRPVIVISNNLYNSSGRDLVVLAITSNSKEREHTIPIDNNSMSQGSLPKVSKIKADHIIKLSKTIIAKELGIVKLEVLRSAISEFKSVIDIMQANP